MVIEEAIENILLPVVAGGVFGNVAAQNCATPYVVYFSIVSPTETDLDGRVLIEQSIIQIDVWHESFADLKRTHAQAVKDALAAANEAGTVVCVPRSARDRYDAVKKLHGVTFEYSFWYH